MSANDVPVANPEAVLREEFDDWAVLFNPVTGDAVGTNPVGVAVWKLMDGRHTIDEIVGELDRRFDDVSDTASDEIRAFIDNLVQRGFVGFEGSP